MAAYHKALIIACVIQPARRQNRNAVSEHEIHTRACLSQCCLHPYQERLIVSLLLLLCFCAAESQRPVGDCFLAVLSSHGEEGCVFGADGKAVLLSRIFALFDNKHMESKAKLFLIQVWRSSVLLPLPLL